MKLDLKIPVNVLALSRLFKANNHQLLLVGGCVRDALLEIEPKDFDLVTDATPDEVIDILKQDSGVTNVLQTGKSFGVINAIMFPDEEYEIATFRTDGNYQDGRRPDGVEFTTIEEDVLRRDLTINALYYDIDKGEVIDLVDGIEDLYKKIVRTVGNPKDRLGEDRLRVLRAIRFAERFDSLMTYDLQLEIGRDSDISQVSGERIRDEFIKIVKSTGDIERTLNTLNTYGLLNQIFPNILLSNGIKYLSVDKTNLSYLEVIIYILQGNEPSELKKALNELKYSRSEVHNIVLGVEILRLVNSFNYLSRVDEIYQLTKKFQNGNPDISLLKKLDGCEAFIDKMLNFTFEVTASYVTETFGLEPGKELGLKIRELEEANIVKFFN